MRNARLLINNVIRSNEHFTDVLFTISNAVTQVSPHWLGSFANLHASDFYLIAFML